MSVTVKLKRVEGKRIITSIPVIRNGRKVGFEFDPKKTEFDVEPDVAARALEVEIDGEKGFFVVADPGSVTRIGDQTFEKTEAQKE